MIIVLILVAIVAIYLYTSRKSKKNETLDYISPAELSPPNPVMYDFSDQHENDPEFISTGPGTYTAAGRPGAEF